MNFPQLDRHIEFNSRPLLAVWFSSPPKSCRHFLFFLPLLVLSIFIPFPLHLHIRHMWDVYSWLCVFCCRPPPLPLLLLRVLVPCLFAPHLHPQCLYDVSVSLHLSSPRALLNGLWLSPLFAPLTSSTAYTRKNVHAHTHPCLTRTLVHLFFPSPSVP